MSADSHGVLVEAIAKWRDDPVLFVEEALGANPATWQREFLTNIQNNLRISVRAGRGPGKSCTVSWVIFWFILTREPSLILVTGPKYDQIIDVIWAEAELWRQKLPEFLRDVVIVQKDLIYVRGMERINRAIVRTAGENTDVLRGYHNENMLIICEESSGIADKAFIVGEGSMSTPGARTVLVGNMSRGAGYFYDTHFTDDRWVRMVVNSETVAEERPDIVSREYIEHMRKKYGVDSDEYRIEVLGEPPLVDQKAVIPRFLIEDAALRTVARYDGYLPIWGLDVGRSRDKTALAKRMANHLLEPVKTWATPDTTVIPDLLVEEYRRQEREDRKLLPLRINIESTGLGGPVYDACKREGLPVRAVNPAEAHSSSDKYLRKRDDLWFRAKSWFSERNCWIPTDRELMGELASVECSLMMNGKWKVQSKDEIVAQNKESPNRADAFILTFDSGYDKIPTTPGEDRYRLSSGGVTGSVSSWLSM